MQMSDAELASFHARCLTAAQRGYSVARAERYMEALEAEAGSVEVHGAEIGSAGYLVAMASAAKAARAGGGKKKATSKRAPELKVPEPEPVKMAEPVPEPVKVQELEPVKVAEPKIQEPEPEPELEPVKVAEPKTPEPPKSSPKASSGTKAKKKEPIVPISYDTWTYDELYAEAQKRDIPLRSSMNKKELIEAMEADDAEKAFPETR